MILTLILMLSNLPPRPALTAGFRPLFFFYPPHLSRVTVTPVSSTPAISCCPRGSCYTFQKHTHPHPHGNAHSPSRMPAMLPSSSSSSSSPPASLESTLLFGDTHTQIINPTQGTGCDPKSHRKQQMAHETTTNTEHCVCVCARPNFIKSSKEPTDICRSPPYQTSGPLVQHLAVEKKKGDFLKSIINSR